MKRLLLTLCCTLATALFADTWTDTETHITWTYTLSNGKASLGSGSSSIPAVPTSYAGALVIPASINGNPVVGLNDYAFYNCSLLTSIDIPEGVISIGYRAIGECKALTELTIPASVETLGQYAFAGAGLVSINFEGTKIKTFPIGLFHGTLPLKSIEVPEGVETIEYQVFSECSNMESVVFPSTLARFTYNQWSIYNVFYHCGLTSVVFLGPYPENYAQSGLTDMGSWSRCNLSYSCRFGGSWVGKVVMSRRASVVETLAKAGVTVTAEMTTPKTMRVTYSVESTQPKVKVRAVAWKDGVRSFANIVPVKTAAEGTPEAVPNGGEVATGVAHTFLWQVSEDWATDLDKVALEILVAEGTLLPQEKITIPALGDHPEITITRNRLTTLQLFDALVWCYAEGDDTLTVTDGVVKVNGTQVASRDSLTAYGCNNTALLNYLYGKMGYRVLAGEDLAWARAATRLELAASGLDQVSVKITEE